MTKHTQAEVLECAEAYEELGEPVGAAYLRAYAALLGSEPVARLAIAEHAAWKHRNACRKEFREWLSAYTSATGEWYAPGGEPEDDEAHDRLKLASVSATKALKSARAATRRAIALITAPKEAML